MATIWLIARYRYINGQVTSRDYDPLPLISALNLVLQQHAARTGVRVGKNRYFFPNLNDRVDLSPTIEAWRGFYTSVRPAYKELMVNVYVCIRFLCQSTQGHFIAMFV